MRINTLLQPNPLKTKIERMFELSAQKIHRLQSNWDPQKGAPVFTAAGKYTSRGWTEWTQGFLYGAGFLQYDATGDTAILERAQQDTLAHMAPHLTHTGVHDHGFNNISTYGNWLRLMNEGKIAENEWQQRFCELALKCSGAVQAMRWSTTADGTGYIASFNGPHSLFIDTIRSLRVLGVAYRLGHVLKGEHDESISLLQRLIEHARNTARYNVYYGNGRDAYDIRGRTVHEAIFNRNDGHFRCPSTQQGYSPFSTWTRGLAWAILGYAEQLEFLRTLPAESFEPFGGQFKVLDEFLETAMATADFYIQNTPADGIPYWDTGAPGLAHMGDYLDRPADPYNDHEPVDSSAAAIAAQGFVRLAKYLNIRGQTPKATEYYQAGLTIADALFDEPYLSTQEDHEGLILHAIYHRPNGWDHVPAGSKIPNGEACMWGDYHARELGVLLLCDADGKCHPTFFT